MTHEFGSNSQGTSLMFSQFNPFDFDRMARDTVLTSDIIQQNPASVYVGVRANSGVRKEARIYVMLQPLNRDIVK